MGICTCVHEVPQGRDDPEVNSNRDSDERTHMKARKALQSINLYLMASSQCRG
jgi:hypothetical protein